VMNAKNVDEMELIDAVLLDEKMKMFSQSIKESEGTHTKVKQAASNRPGRYPLVLI